MNGIDFAFGHLDIPSAKRDNIFVCRYCSTPGNPKNLTPEEASAYLLNSIPIVLNFETTGVSYHGGYNSGVPDAGLALTATDELRWPRDRPVIFSIDEDIQPAQYVLLDGYITGLSHAMAGRPIGIYGSYGCCAHIRNTSNISPLVQYLWQTYAWSEGQLLSGVNLYQHQNDVSAYGVNCDLDMSLTADFGQHPFTSSSIPNPWFPYEIGGLA